MGFFSNLFRHNQSNGYNPADYIDEEVDTSNGRLSTTKQTTIPISDVLSGEEKETLTKSINKKGKAVSLENDYQNFMGSYSALGGSLNTLTDVLNQKRALRHYAKDSLVQSIIRTRINQVLVYARPSRFSRTGKGFEIVPRNGSEDKKELSTQKLNQIKKIEDKVASLGDDGDYTYSRKSFANFLSSWIYDRFVYDQVNVERVFNKDGSLDHFNNVDASTVVISNQPKSIDSPRTFAQYSANFTGQPIAKFNEKELTFYTANNYGEVERNGYGFGEVEASLLHLKYHQDTEQFNARFFSQGGSTRGILLINYGNANAQQNASALAALRRQWQTSFSGNNGAWKTPVMTGQDAKYINMTQTSKDMEFEHWLNYLINIISSVFQIQPDEINFPNKGGASGMKTGNSVNEGSTSASKMQQSKDKGLEPLLQAIEDFMTNEIVRYIDKDYIFRFTLGDSEDATREQDIIQKKLANGETIGEARTEMGLPELDVTKLPDSMKFINSMPGTPATIVQMMQFVYSQDQASQYTMQHKNDIDPNKARNGQPDKAMPLNAIDDKTKHPDQNRTLASDKANGTDQTEDPDDVND